MRAFCVKIEPGPDGVSPTKANPGPLPHSSAYVVQIRAVPDDVSFDLAVVTGWRQIFPDPRTRIDSAVTYTRTHLRDWGWSLSRVCSLDPQLHLPPLKFGHAEFPTVPIKFLNSFRRPSSSLCRKGLRVFLGNIKSFAIIGERIENFLNVEPWVHSIRPRFTGFLQSSSNPFLSQKKSASFLFHIYLAG